jgi:predicted dithiol-disulfide oxidoreductase (DUF899 family)
MLIQWPVVLLQIRAQHDMTYVVVSRALLPEIEPFEKRMGRRFKWVSSLGADFNYDFHTSFKPDGIARSRLQQG